MSPSPLTYTLFFLVLFCFSKSNGFLLYGDSCDPNEVNDPDLACNLNFGLTCRDTICDCLNPSDMIANTTFNGCSTLIGGNCKVVNQSELELPCVSNAECDYSGSDSEGYVCSCSSYYSPTDDRTCKMGHSGPCKDTLDCNTDELLVCTNNYCQCPNPLKQYFVYSQTKSALQIERSRKCHAKIRTSCDPNATESEIQCNPVTSKCAPDSNSISGYSCACDESQGWLEDFNHLCQRGYQQSCIITLDTGTMDSINDCNYDARLFCSEDKCVCRYEPDQVWDEELKLCASVEGSPCDLMDDGANAICQTGLECLRDRGPLEGICQISSTTVPTGGNSDNPSTSETNDSNKSGSIQSINLLHHSLKYLAIIITFYFSQVF